MEKQLKINVLGTHGVGKSTLSFQIANFLKHNDVNVKIIAENIRACPFPINEEATIWTELWVYHKCILDELESIAEQYKAIILDRGVLDGIVYFLERNSPNKYYRQLCDMAFEWAQEEYDLFVLVEPADPDKQYSTDAVRDPNIEYRKRIMILFREFLQKLSDEAKEKVIVVTDEEIFHKDTAITKIAAKLNHN